MAEWEQVVPAVRSRKIPLKERSDEAVPVLLAHLHFVLYGFLVVQRDKALYRHIIVALRTNKSLC